MSRSELSLWLLAAAAAACHHDPVIEPTSCPAPRQLANGECCPALHRARDDGCQPASFSALGAPPALGVDADALVAAIDGEGELLLVWSETDRLRFATESSGELVVSDGPELFGTPLQLDLAVGESSTALLTWRQTGFLGNGLDEAAIFVSQRAANGSFELRPDPLSLGVDAYQPRAGIGPDGDAVVTWNQWTGAHYGVAVASARTVGEPFAIRATEADVLSAPIFYSNAPRVAVGASGAYTITWYQSVGGPLLTYVAERAHRVEEPVRPDPGSPLSPSDAPVDGDPLTNPKVALGARGEAAVAWTQEDGEGHVATYLATRDASGSWTRPASLADSLGPRIGRARSVQVAFGALGELFVVWEQDERIALALRSADGEWITPRESPQHLSAVGAQALEPSIAAAPHGGTVIAYRVREPGGVFRVVATWTTSDDLVMKGEVVLSRDEDGDAQAPVVSVGQWHERAVVAWLSGGAQRAVRFATLSP